MTPTQPVLKFDATLHHSGAEQVTLDLSRGGQEELAELRHWRALLLMRQAERADPRLFTP